MVVFITIACCLFGSQAKNLYSRVRVQFAGWLDLSLDFFWLEISVYQFPIFYDALGFLDSDQGPLLDVSRKTLG